MQRYKNVKYLDKFHFVFVITLTYESGYQVGSFEKKTKIKNVMQVYPVENCWTVSTDIFTLIRCALKPQKSSFYIHYSMYIHTIQYMR
jgi:hypothetical protein